MTCLTCTQWTLKGSNLARFGFGLCKAEAGIFRNARMHAPGHNCEQHQKVSDEQSDIRKTYLAKAATAGSKVSRDPHAAAGSRPDDDARAA